MNRQITAKRRNYERKARATFAAYITINGRFSEKFISELITNDIQIYEICQQNGFTAVIKPYSYLKTARIAENTEYDSELPKGKALYSGFCRWKKMGLIPTRAVAL
ncbi:MAG: hypothetical protein ACLS48_00640 [[Eubacterium] siraeum]